MGVYKDFDDFFCKKNDDVDNATYDYILGLIGLTDSELPWDIGMIHEIAEIAVEMMRKKGYPVCYPFNEFDEIAEEDVPCYMSKSRCKLCIYKEDEVADATETETEMEKAFVEFRDVCIVEPDETEYGEKVVWLYLTDGTSIEACHETYGLDKDFYYYSVRRHCSEEDFDNDVYHETMGVIDVGAFETLDETVNFVKELVEKYN